MDDEGNQSVRFEMSQMFTQSSFCKVYELTSARQSGQTLHSHDYTQIWYVTRGRCEHWVGGKRHDMVLGEAFLLPPCVEHRTVLGPDSAVLCCEFALDRFLTGAAGEHYRRLHDTALDLSFMLLIERKRNDVTARLAFSEPGQARVGQIMGTLLEEYTRRQPFYEDALSLLILELLLVFGREHVQASAHEVSSAAYAQYRSQVEKAIRHIDEHYAEPLTLEEMCRLSMVSKTYFCYLFKRLTSRTFLEYLTNMRVHKAAQLLREPRYSVAAVGQLVGFGDAAHFSRTFRRIAGVSPRAYRASLRREADDKTRSGCAASDREAGDPVVNIPRIRHEPEPTLCMDRIVSGDLRM